MKLLEQLDRKFPYVPFSKATVYFSLLILVVTCFALHVLKFIKENFGEAVYVALLGVVMAGVCLAFLLIMKKI